MFYPDSHFFLNWNPVPKKKKKKKFCESCIKHLKTPMCSKRIFCQFKLKFSPNTSSFLKDWRKNSNMSGFYQTGSLEGGSLEVSISNTSRNKTLP